MSWMIIPIAATVGLTWELFSERILERLHKPQWRINARKVVWLILATSAWLISWMQNLDDQERKQTIAELRDNSSDLRKQLGVATISLSNSLDVAAQTQLSLSNAQQDDL